MRRVRLPDSAHLARSWRIHALTPDFRLEDVWALPTHGGPADFPQLVEAFLSDRLPFTGIIRTVEAVLEELGTAGGPADLDGLLSLDCRAREAASRMVGQA